MKEFCRHKRVNASQGKGHGSFEQHGNIIIYEIRKTRFTKSEVVAMLTDADLLANFQKKKEGVA